MLPAVSALTDTPHFSHLLSDCERVFLRASETTPHVKPLLGPPFNIYVYAYLLRSATLTSTTTVRVKHSAFASKVCAPDQTREYAL